MTVKRLCINCGHGTDAWEYGNYTVLRCGKEHFPDAFSLRGLREHIHRAESCSDFTTEPQMPPVLTCYSVSVLGWAGRK